MKDLRKTHRRAMEMSAVAEKHQHGGNELLYKQFKELAFILEKEAAMELKDSYESEPTRGVLFRSAAALAFELEFYHQSREMAELGLSGNPYPEIRAQLDDLMANANELLTKSLAAGNNLNQEGKKTAPDYELILRLREGDGAAFSDLYHRYAQSAWTFAIQIINDRAISENIVENAFIKLYKNIRSDLFPPLNALHQGLLNYVRQMSIDYLRKPKFREKDTILSETFSDTFGESDPEFLDKIFNTNKILEGLSEHQKNLIWWRFRDKLSYEEIASRLETRFEFAKENIVKTLQIIKEALRDYLEIPVDV